MAHPTIDITQEPDPDCLHPAYNCVKYCFQCNDFLVSVGTKAVFSAEMPNTIFGYAYGINWIIAGQPYVTAPNTSYKEFDTQPGTLTPAQFALNLKSSLEFNNYVFEKFIISIVGDAVNAEAREIGVIPNFIFDYTVSPPGVINSDTNGTDNVYRDNYRLIVEIWECDGQDPVILISKGAYIPNADGTFCINIGEKIAGLLETTFVHKIAVGLNSNWFYDYTISKEICLRYGELYSDDIQECNVELRDFVNSDSVIVVNSAFQREEQEDKTLQLCGNEFMTSTPDFSTLCEDSLVFLWINLIDLFALVVNPNLRLHPYYELTYSDGTTTTHIGAQFVKSPNPSNNGFFAIGAGLPTISTFLNPNKQLLYWRARVVLQENADPNTNQYWASQYFKYIPCCDAQIDFYFLNEFGGIDTILMQQVIGIELNQQFSVTETFTDCESNDALESGADIIAQEAFDVLTITSQFANDYQTRLWLRQAIMSPKKWIRTTIKGQDDIFYKIIALDTSTIYYNESDSSLYLTLQYRINERLNVQKN